MTYQHGHFSTVRGAIRDHCPLLGCYICILIYICNINNLAKKKGCLRVGLCIQP